MAKFITTKGISYYIEEIIKNAKSKLILVTPYLRLSKSFVERLIDANRRGVKIILIYGKKDLHDYEWEKVNSIPQIELFFCEDLHAKCYCNETSMIITSMNLHQYSETNNREMGILINKKEDANLFSKGILEIKSIVSVSEKIGADAGRLLEYDEFYKLSLNRLKETLSKEYSNAEFEINNDLGRAILVIDKLPLDGFRIEIDYRLKISFEDRFKYFMWYDIKAFI